MTRDELLNLEDADLLAQCEQACFRATGPGGQHRNTRDSAVRLTLPEHELSVTAVNDRSQHRNRATALKKLRLEIAMQLREPPRAWDGAWKIGRKDRHYPFFIAAVFDSLAANDYQVGDAARQLGTSTGRLVRLLANDEDAWAKVNQERQRRDLHPLRMP